MSKNGGENTRIKIIQCKTRKVTSKLSKIYDRELRFYIGFWLKETTFQPKSDALHRIVDEGCLLLLEFDAVHQIVLVANSIQNNLDVP